MKKISKRKFVVCFSYDQEVPVEDGKGCCEFYDGDTDKCEYNKYASKKHHILSEREEVYRQFSGTKEPEDY